MYNKYLLKEKAVASLQEFYRSHGRSPRRFEAKASNGLFSPETYFRAFSCKKMDWSKILKKAGLPVYDRVAAKETAIQTLRDFYLKHQRSPKTSELCEENGLFSFSKYHAIFGRKSWKEIIKISKLPPVTKKRNSFTKKQAIQSLREFYKKYGREPKTTDTNTTLAKNPEAYYRALNCKSWNDVLKKAGLSGAGYISRSGPITKEQALISLQKFYALNGRSPRRNESNSKQGLYCPQIYFREFGIETRDWETMIKKAGFPNSKPLYVPVTMEKSCLQIAELPVSKKKDRKTASEKRIRKKTKTVPAWQLITAEQAILSLQEFYQVNGRSPLASEINEKNHLYSVQTYKKLFNCREWTKVLETIGLPLPLKGQQITLEQAVLSLTDFARKYGRMPLSTDTHTKELHALATYFKLFDCKTWRCVLLYAGLLKETGGESGTLEPHKTRAESLSDKDLLATLKASYIKNGETPKIRQIRESSTIIKRFGTWNNALEKAGIPLRKFAPTKTMLLQSLMDFYLKHQRAPKAEEAKVKNGLFDRATYFNILAVTSWPDVLEMANLRKYRKRSKDNGLNKEEFAEKIGKICKDNNLSTVVEYKHFGGLPNIKHIIKLFGSWKNFCICTGIKKGPACEKNPDQFRRILVQKMEDYAKKNNLTKSSNVSYDHFRKAEFNLDQLIEICKLLKINIEFK